ncbi:haloacid dehalogenase-like hydrolase [Scardovia inopinata]|uniref:Haloacid dehalogenase-like hydrolase n=1 Tax=Scardovia inopinata F0304 TaxID=641146 RepID=W5II77_SCAIO|nr:HAD family hydrolase [Scardovia inopinata]EFG26572.2 hypothetical protein HMPREF9020_00194 [Scardovia inopinata F0304]BAR06171.1 conserved hypothetical protein [Scardovia inopinata JCM 12537]SUV51691.1 haloacid dehalogenase-like hydrolase [Scardovia inopinata]
MEENEFNRLPKEDKPVLAICYDFDKTLSPTDMQAQGFIQKVMDANAKAKNNAVENPDFKEEAKENSDDNTAPSSPATSIKEFWNKSNQLAKDHQMDQNLAWMYQMRQMAHGKMLFTRQELQDYGSKVDLFPGVRDWFSRIRQYGKERGIIVEHYIISSGLREMIEGTPIFNEFTAVFASAFYYDADGVAVWPAQVINFTNKTQFLFRIEKGVIDVNDPAVNDHTAQKDIRVPFRNMIYIGDSDTDVPCMRVINSSGGHSIGVYQVQDGENESEAKQKVYKMMRDERIRYFAEADYEDGSELDHLVKAIIDRTKANEVLESQTVEDQQDADDYYARTEDEVEERQDLINALEDSRNFRTTHFLIRNMNKYSSWSSQELMHLLEIASENFQVQFILNDSDVQEFYQTSIGRLQEQLSDLGDQAQAKAKKLISAVEQQWASGQDDNTEDGNQQQANQRPSPDTTTVSEF